MTDRRFTEVDLRGMLERATDYERDSSMKDTYLEVTFRRGRPIAAYYYLPRRAGQKSYRSRRIEPGLVVDFDRGGQPIGIEITTPQKLSLAALNRVLRQFGFAPVKRAELAPVLAA